MSTTLILTIVLVALVVVAIGAMYLTYQQRERTVRAVDEATDIEDDGAGEEADLDTITPTSSLLGLIAAWRRRSKGRKMANNGYVKWYKIDSEMGTPTWVKPEYRGASKLEYYDSDEDVTYLFPKEAMLRDSTTGAWVAVHRKGEAEPIPLADPAMPAMDADTTQKVIQLETESEPRGFFDKVDLSGQTLIWAVVALMLVLTAAAQMMGGGF